MKPLRLMFIHNSILGAFGEAAIHYFPTALAQIGHQVFMVAKAGGDGSFLRERGVRVFEITADQSWYRSLSSLGCELKPDIVHVFLYSGCGLIPWVMSRSCKAKYVMDIRSPLLRTGIPRSLHRLKNLFEPVGFDAIATHGIESAWTQLGKRRALHWLPPGVDFSGIPKAETVYALPVSRPFRLVYIGSLDLIRQVDRMLEAVIEVAQRYDISLDIYGEGSQRQQLEALVREHALCDRIRFMGRVERTALLAALPGYDAGLAYIPGGIYDTAPALKTLEYLACGLPVLATDTFGNRMFVEHEQNGLLAGVGVGEYAQGLRDLIHHPELATMRKRARPSVTDFDWMHIARNRIVPLYASLMREHE